MRTSQDEARAKLLKIVAVGAAGSVFLGFFIGFLLNPPQAKQSIYFPRTPPAPLAELPRPAQEAMPAPQESERPSMMAMIQKDSSGPLSGAVNSPAAASNNPSEIVHPFTAARSASLPGDVKTGRENSETQSLIESVAGKWTSEKAYAVGLERGMLIKVGESLLHHPKALAAVLNNDMVVKGFMNEERTKRDCNNASSLVDYMSGPNTSPEVHQLTRDLVGALKSPDTASAVFGSRMADTVLNQCSAVQSVVTNPQALVQIFTANQDLLPVVADPTLAAAVSSNRQAAQMLGTLKNSTNGLSALSGLL